MSSDPDPGAVSALALVVQVVDLQSYVTVDTGRWSVLARDVLASEGIEAPAEMSLRFVDIAEIARLKAQYLDGAGEPTDVLSFPIDGADGHVVSTRLVGDVVICPEVAHANAGGNADIRAGHEGSFDHEMALLVVHGVLHLLGMDHAEPDEAATMKSSEQRHLATFWEHCG